MIKFYKAMSGGVEFRATIDQTSQGYFGVSVKARIDEVEISANDSVITTQLTINSTVENTRTQILWTGCYTIDEDAMIKVDVHADDKSIYKVSDLQTAGMHTLTVSTGHEFNTKGDHTVKIYLKEEPVT